jgi:hypothetical protein
MNPRSHLIKVLLRQYIEHKDADNLRVHVWSNAILWSGWITLLSQVPMPVAVPLLGANLGAWWVVASAVYWLPVDAAIPVIVIAWSAVWVALPLVPWGPGQSWLAGVIFPMTTMVVGGLSAFLSHVFYHEHAEYLKTGNKLHDDLETMHAVLWGPFYFWLFALMHAGYRPSLRAELDAAERRRILRRERLSWSNWSGNIRCQPRVACVPFTLDDLCEVVRSASRDGRKLRLVGSGFNWSGMAATDDTLVFCERLKGVEIDRDHRTAWVECGTTNRHLNRVLKTAGLQLPWNVVLENVRVGAIVSVGTHGSGKDTGTLGDLVQAFDIIDANGNRRILSEATIGAEAMDAARLGFGIFGVIARIQLRVEPACRVLQIDRRMKVADGLAELPELVRKRDSVEVFWFPFTDWMWVRTFDRTELPPTFSAHGSWFLAKNFLDMTTVGACIAVISKRFPPLLPFTMRLIAPMITFRERILPLTDALHYRRWLELKRTACIEVGFKVDPAFENFRRAFEDTRRVVDEWAAQGRYPLDLTINVRFTGPSRALLSPAYGPGLTCFMEALFTQRTADWKVFTSELFSLWMSDPSGLPHWAKEFEHVPGIDVAIRERLGARLTKFRAALRGTGIDPGGMFVNDLVRRMFLEESSS